MIDDLLGQSQPRKALVDKLMQHLVVVCLFVLPVGTGMCKTGFTGNAADAAGTTDNTHRQHTQAHLHLQRCTDPLISARSEQFANQRMGQGPRTLAHGVSQSCEYRERESRLNR